MNTKVKVNFVMIGIIKWMPFCVDLSDVFFTNDIVEILNLDDSQAGYLKVGYIIGYRYKIIPHQEYKHTIRNDYDSPDYKKQFTDPATTIISRYYELKGLISYDGNNQISYAQFINKQIHFTPHQFRLYRRPLKNWLKYLWLLLTKYYYN